MQEALGLAVALLMERVPEEHLWVFDGTYLGGQQRRVDRQEERLRDWHNRVVQKLQVDRDAWNAGADALGSLSLELREEMAAWAGGFSQNTGSNRRPRCDRSTGSRWRRKRGGQRQRTAAYHPGPPAPTPPTGVQPVIGLALAPRSSRSPS
jgi:hypothetical protein